jgi:hypothetical protein
MEKEQLDARARKELGLDKQVNEVSVYDEYVKVRKTVIENFDERMWFLTDACQSVINTLLLEDIANPCGLNLIDSPSSGKTTVLSFFDVDGITYRSDSFTPASFVSHCANVPDKKLEEIDLLPRIRYKCIIITELAPTFQKRKEDLVENIATLTKVFDGEGLQKDSGTRGRRGYKGDYLFAWLGASTPFHYTVWYLMGKLGSRLLFLTVANEQSEEDMIEQVVSGLIDEKSYKEKTQKCKEAISDFLRFLWKKTGGVRHVKWDRPNDDNELIKIIVRLANLVAKSRSTVTVWRITESDYNYNQPTREFPPRLSAILYNVARGHAISQGRSRINEEDIRLIIEIGLSSMPDDRRQVLDLLLRKKPGEALETHEIEDNLGVCSPTARAIMKIFDVLGVADHSESMNGVSDFIVLKKEFQWFQSEEFRKLRNQPEKNLTPREPGEEEDFDLGF